MDRLIDLIGEGVDSNDPFFFIPYVLNVKNIIRKKFIINYFNNIRKITNLFLEESEPSLY